MLTGHLTKGSGLDMMSCILGQLTEHRGRHGKGMETEELMTSNGKISKRRPQELGKEQEEVRPRENNEESTDFGY